MARSRFGLFASCSVLFAVVLASAGCGGSRENDAMVGEISIALGVVPTGVACVRITAAGSITVTKSVSTTAGSTVTTQMTGLPLGPVVFSAQAFSQACSSVTSSSMPTWLSDSVTVTLAAGSKPAINLVMKTAPIANVTVDFNPDAGPAVCTPGTTTCVGTSVQTCNLSGAWVISACPFSCVAGACTGICAPGTTQCSGNTPQVCTTGGVWQNTGSACPGCYTCSAATGACVANTGGSCDDGNACTSGETCQAGVCAAGTTVTCAAGACQIAGTCSPSGGCPTTTSAPNGYRDPKCTNSNYPVCVSGTCQQCYSNSDCKTPYPSCNTTTHLCVECISDADCSAKTTKSCDTTKNQCVCRLPSAGNLLKNPGFDKDLSSWDTNGEVSWHANDADGCANSGEAYSIYSAEEPAQCVAVSPGTYWFGATFNYSYYYDGSYCFMYFYSSAGCNDLYRFNQSNGVGPQGANLTIPASGWQSYSTQVTVPAGTVSARVVCNLDENTAGNGVDQIYLNKSANSF